MALEQSTNQQSFVANAGQTNFEFLLPYFEASDIKVTIQEVDGNIIDPSDYTFTVVPINDNEENGANITLSIANPLAAGDTVVISREVPYTQQYDLQEGATIDPTALNKAFDRVVAQNQQQNDLFNRTIEFPITDPDTITYTVDSANNRAGKALGFDTNGNVTEISLAATGSFSANDSRGLTIPQGTNVIEAKVDGTKAIFDNGNISVGTIDETNISNDSISLSKMQDNSVSTNEIVNNSVEYSKLQQSNSNRVALGAINQGNINEIPITNGLDTVSQLHDQLASSKSIKDYVDEITSQMIGVGQTWQLVSRSLDGTEYTNSTGKPIMLNLRTSGNLDNHKVDIHIKPIGGSFVTFALIAASNSGGAVDGNGSTIIPNNSVYKLTKSGDAITATQYAELR